MNYVVPTQLSDDERAIYNFVVRRFLACCSEDAKGELTTLEIKYGGEIFRTSGLLVLERNYLDVYPFEKWESSQQLPPFTIGEEFEPTEAMITDGKTAKPGYLTEPELIGLMDANGIGTDATMAEHIAKIKERSYVMTRAQGGGTSRNNNDSTLDNRGTRGSRGRGGSRAGRGGNSGRNDRSSTRTGAVDEFIPTTLGVALIEGYDKVGLEASLSKPFLRKEVGYFLFFLLEFFTLTQPEKMEIQMKAICAGTRSRNDVVQQNLEQYRDVFVRTQQQINVLKEVSNVKRCGKTKSNDTKVYSSLHSLVDDIFSAEAQNLEANRSNKLLERTMEISYSWATDKYIMIMITWDSTIDFALA